MLVGCEKVSRDRRQSDPWSPSRPRNVINVHAYAGRGSMMAVAAHVVRGLQGPAL